jgi:cytochrome P450
VAEARETGLRAVGFPVGASVALAELERDPHPVHARLRAAEPVSWLPVLDGWLVTRRDLALQVMRDAETFTVDDPRFSTAQVIGASMLSLDGVEHARHRDPFARPFRLDAVRARFAGVVEREVDVLLDELEPLGAADLRRELAAPLSALTMVEALGLEGTDPAQVLAWYSSIVAAVTEITAGRDPGRAGADAFAALSASLEPSLDLDPAVSLVAAAGRHTGLLSQADVVSNAAVLLFGGIETTEAMIANLLLHVLGTEGAREAVQSDPAVLANAVEESLRLEPAAAVVDRYAVRGVELSGAPVGERELVRVSLAAANRDPAVFPDPDRYDVHRQNARLQAAFAHGPHVCLGMHLARLEAQVALRRSLERLPGLRLDPGRPPLVTGLVFRKPAALHALWDGPRGTLSA